MTPGKKQQSPKPQAAPETGKTFLYVGYAGAFVLSLIFPNLTSPMNPTMPFVLGGFIAAVVGYAVMTWLLNKRNVSGGKKWSVTGGAALLGVGAAAWYRVLFLAEEHATPTFGIELLEFGLFCAAYFFIFAVLCTVYRYGGLQLIRMFGRAPTAGV